MMFWTVARFEWSRLMRSPGSQAALVSIGLALLLSLILGGQNQRQRLRGLDQESAAFEDERRRFQAVVADHERRGDAGSSEECTQPCVYEGLPYKARTLAVLPPHALSTLLTLPEGVHPDKALVKQYISLVPNAFGEMFDERYLYSAVVESLGRLDPAFILIWVVPLYIIACCYNILSEEREAGTLPLLLSQPLSLLSILAGKVLARGLLSLLPCLVLVAGTPLASAAAWHPEDWSRLGLLAAAGLLYSMFWILICVWANLCFHTSPAALTVAGGVWMLLVLAAPQQFSLFQSTLDPRPSRVQLMNELRAFGQAETVDEDRIWIEFLRHHPEFDNARRSKVLLSTQKSYAAVLFAEQLAAAAVAQHESLVRARRARQDQWLLLSPAMAFGRIIENLAGQAPERYEEFRRQSLTFRNQWRETMAQRMFTGVHLTARDLASLPRFTFAEESIQTVWPRIRPPLAMMLAWLLLPLLIALLFASKRRTIL